jgi:hypothetical protein
VKQPMNSVLGAVLLVATSPIWLTLVLLVALWVGLQYFVLYGLVWSWWIGSRKKRVLFVYSHSPNWQDHLERTVIPHLPPTAVVLNWSERQRWPRFALPVLLFRFFGGTREFNPIGLVFERFALVRRYRFWKPFRELKHGHPEALGDVEAQFLEDAIGQHSGIQPTPGHRE